MTTCQTVPRCPLKQALNTDISTYVIRGPVAIPKIRNFALFQSRLDKQRSRMGPISAGRIRLPSVLSRVAKDSGNRVLIVRRKYHDESFGFRKPRDFTIADCVSDDL